MKNYYVSISLSLGIISFVSIGPAYFMILEYGTDKVEEEADSNNESDIEDINRMGQGGDSTAIKGLSTQ